MKSLTFGYKAELKLQLKSTRLFTLFNKRVAGCVGCMKHSYLFQKVTTRFSKSCLYVCMLKFALKYAANYKMPN